EIYDYLRLLYARVGTPHCPICDRLINPQTIDQIVDQVLALKEGTKIQIMAPLISGRKGEYQALFQELRKEGFVRVRVDGQVVALEDDIELEKNKTHTIHLVVDRLIVKPNMQSRLADSLSLGLKWGKSNVLVDVLGDNASEGNDAETGAETKRREMLFSEHFACGNCNVSFAEISPRIFSFNSPY